MKPSSAGSNKGTSGWPALMMSNFCTMAVKNLYRDVLAKTSPKHRRLPMPKGMTRACGVKVRTDPSGDLAKYD